MQNNFSFDRYCKIIIHTPHAGTDFPIYFVVVKHQLAAKRHGELRALFP